MIDLAAARQAFEDSVDGTVGLEEEFAILDPATLDLVDRYEDLCATAAGDEVLTASLSGELIASEIEIRSGRGISLADARRRQDEHRVRLFAAARALGVRLAAQGTHPWSDYREQRNIDTEHYRRVVDGLQYVARRNNTFSLHVHVGVRGADRAVRVCDRLRPVLPTLLAVSSNSPFLDARDTGLHSARTQAFTRTFPRCGVPDAYGSWAAYADYIDLLVRTRSIVEYTQVWWSVRPHFSFGTVEMRICDAQSTSGEADALSALIVACIAQAARDEDDGVALPDVPGRLVEENTWRAIRHGMDGELIDLDRLEVRPAGAALEALWAWTAPVRAELGIGDGGLPARNGTQRQRDLLATGATMQEAFASAVAETEATYGAARAASPVHPDAEEAPAR